MTKMKGFTLIELLIVVAIIAILAAIAVPNFLEAQIRAKVSRARTDMRSVSVAVEAYYVDNNIYPAWGPGAGIPPNTITYNQAILAASVPPKAGGAGGIPCFLMSLPRIAGANFFTLTTPISFITTYPADPFATNRGCTFGYQSYFPGAAPVIANKGGVGWIMWSFGPDTDEYKGTPGDSCYGPYNPATAQPSVILLVGDSGDANDNGSDAFTYDPTNGTVSGGDVWRVKQ
jgi:prepilin-type N-terminal cleavage/methylation domain-containing protein